MLPGRDGAKTKTTIGGCFMKYDTTFDKPVQQYLQFGSKVKMSNTLAQSPIIHPSNSVFNNRIFAALVSTINKEDTDFFESYVIEVKELIKAQPGVDYWKKIKDTCESLINTKGRIIGKDKDGNMTLGLYNFFMSIEYESGFIRARFSPFLKPYLLQLRREFTQFNLIEFLNLSTMYAQNLFRYLKSWEHAGGKKEEIGILHEILNVPESARKNFKEFRVSILEKAIKDINIKTELRVDYKVIKVGGINCKTGKVTHIEFIIKTPKTKKELDIDKTEQNLLTFIDQSKTSEIKTEQQIEPAEVAEVTAPGEFEPPKIPVAPIWPAIAERIALKFGREKFDTWFTDGFYAFMNKDGELVLDFRNAGECVYVERWFGPVIKKAINEIAPNIKLRMCHGVISGWIAGLQKEHEDKARKQLDMQLEEEKIENQFLIIAKIYPRHRVDGKKSYRLFERLRKERINKLKECTAEELKGKDVIPTVAELISLLEECKESKEWTKDNKRYVPKLSKWLESKPWLN